MHHAVPSSAPHLLVARQPILNRDADVVAYELLARHALTAGEWTGLTDDSRTTARVIGQAFLDMDVWSITEGLPAYVNFTRALLLDGTAWSLPAALTVVEIVETVTPDAAVRDACRRLRAAGYRIALDDVVADDQRLSLLPLIDVAKIDFAATSPSQRAQLVARCRDAGVQVLAEKVETPEQHAEAVRLGCDLFQGYLFFEPAVIGRRQDAGVRLLHLQLLRSVTEPPIDRDTIGNVLARDPGAAARFGQLWTVLHATSGPPPPVVLALARLDDATLARLITLLVVMWLGERRPRPLLDTTLIRARFCEQLTVGRGGGVALDGYLVGLCSLLDALVGEPLAEVLERIRPPAALTAACLLGAGPLGRVLGLVRAYEQGDWASVRDGSSAIAIDGGMLGPLYLDCLAWARDLLRRVRAAAADW